MTRVGILYQAGSAVPVSTGWRWIAVGIAAGFLVLLYVIYSLLSRSWNPANIVEGMDGVSSTSKFQWLLWLVVILFAYVALWVIRVKQGDWSAISSVPANLLTVLGFSTGTAIAAKGITSGYVQSNRLTKQDPKTAAAIAGAAAGGAAAAAPAPTGGLLQDDSGVPELAKIQMIGFTLVAVGIFLATVIHQIAGHPVQTDLPNIDSSLLVLMGLSQGGYLGKKLVTMGSPVLYPISAPSGPPATVVNALGACFGSTQAGNQLCIDGTAVPVTSWSDSKIVFAIPALNPATGAAWVRPQQQVQLSVLVNGQSTNEVPYSVT